MTDIATVELLVTADRAMFPRPEFRRDQISYDVPTPAAIRGALDRIHWRPALRWVVESIGVLRPIMFEETVLEDNFGATRQRALRDVAYVIRAHFELTDRAGPRDEPERHAGMFRRSLRAPPPLHLGVETSAALASSYETGGSRGTAEGATRDLGWMVYDTDYTHRRQLLFFRAEMVDGTIAVPPPGSDRLYG